MSRSMKIEAGSGERRALDRSCARQSNDSAFADRPSRTAHRQRIFFLSSAGLLAAVLWGAGAPARVPVAEIENITHKGLYQERFSLSRDAEVMVEAVGSGSQEKGALFAYAWILDLRERKVVWHMDADEAEETRHEDNIGQSDRVRLPAGDYALYFSAIGGSFPVHKAIRILKFLDLGTVSLKGANYLRWDELGEPSEWRAVVSLDDADRGALAAPGALPPSPAVLRLDRIPNGAFRRALLEVTSPVELRVLAIGEYAADAQSFADGAWISDVDACERLWEMSLVNTVPAGGAEKNRAFDGTVVLEPGRYLACYMSDDSHAYDVWNSQPPYDPDSWGLTLIPAAPLAPGALRVALDPPDENVIACIERVGDSEYREAVFHLRRSARVCVRALGEWGKEERNVDFGWIEDARTLEKVWTMENKPGRYATGEPRNRIVEEAVALEAGIYRVGYVTDDTHSYAKWHSQPPFDPSAWGIRVCGLGRDFSMASVDLDVEDDLPTLIRLAPAGDDVRKQARFRVEEPLTVRLIALGEGDSDEMYDYAWLVEEKSGKDVWRMTYADTRPAGGAGKNRRADRTLTLAPGTYALHYKSDGSHAFGDWNAAPPADPQLWGVTLIEVGQ